MLVRWIVRFWILTLVLTACTLCPVGLAQDDMDGAKKPAKKAKKSAAPPSGPAAPTRIAPKAPEKPAPPEIVPERNDPATLDDFWQEIDFQLSAGQMNRANRLLVLMSRLKDLTPERVLELRERYGSGLLVRLASTPELGEPALRLVAMANQAAAAKYSDPERIRKFLANLGKSPSQTAYAIEQLRISGRRVVPYFAEAIKAEPGRADVLTSGLARMPAELWPAAAAFLDSEDLALQHAGLAALDAYGDPACVEALWFPAAAPKSAPEIRRQAAATLARFTGVRNVAEAPTALTKIAWKYYNHRGARPQEIESATIWMWEEGKLKEVVKPAAEADRYYGVLAAQQALQLDAKYEPAKTALASLALDQPAPSAALQSAFDPPVLSRVLKQALAEQRSRTVLNAIREIAKKNSAAQVAQTLADALNYPNPRVQFEAASALLASKPVGRFPGVDRIIPILSRTLSIDTQPVALVLDGDLGRSNETAGLLRLNGFQTRTFQTGRAGVAEALASAAVELVVVEPTIQFPGLRETVADLRADARTATIPILVFRYDVVSTSRPVILRPLTEIERTKLRERQDWQIQMEGLRSELYDSAVLVASREKRLYTKEDRVAKILHDMSYIADPTERAKFLADIPDDIPVKQNLLRDPLEIREQEQLAFDQTSELENLKSAYRNVAVLPHLNEPGALGKALGILFGDLTDPPLSPAERQAQQQSALDWISRIVAGEFRYLDPRPVSTRLSYLLTTADVGPKAAEILGRMPSAASQRKLADLVLSEPQPVLFRLAASDGLTQSVRRGGRAIDLASTTAIVRLFVATPAGPFHDSLGRLVAAFGPTAQRAAVKMAAAGLRPPALLSPPPRVAQEPAKATPKAAKPVTPQKKSQSSDDEN